VNIRPATADDLPSLLSLERKCSSAAHWTRLQYEQLFHPASGGFEWFVRVVDGIPSTGAAPAQTPDATISILAFLVARHLAPDWELENIVVDPASRRTGLGKRLLDALFAAALETNSEAVFLEVRESNTPARSLYEKAGFHLSGRRKSYYSNPIEDSILYHKNLR